MGKYGLTHAEQVSRFHIEKDEDRLQAGMSEYNDDQHRNGKNHCAGLNKKAPSNDQSDNAWNYDKPRRTVEREMVRIKKMLGDKLGSSIYYAQEELQIPNPSVVVDNALRRVVAKAITNGSELVDHDKILGAIDGTLAMMAQDKPAARGR